MDDQQTNKSSQQDDSAAVLPLVQSPIVDDMLAGLGPSPSVPPTDDSQQTIPDSRSLITVPDLAGDNDIIEKEWVLKAKQIVEHTAEDPFAQQQELSKMKADYMKKRYNKDLGSGTY